MKRFVVCAADGTSLGAIVAKAGGDESAVADGRVFIGRRRASLATDSVSVGDEVTIAPPVLADAHGVSILARDGDIVAVAKPAGIPTIADHGGASHALVARVAAALGVPEERVHPTSRLDRDVSGVVVFALSKEARERLARARDEQKYTRRYVAIATGVPDAAAGKWAFPIGRAHDARHRAVEGRDATSAETHFSVTARAGTYALLALSPVTGRTHQLRVHAAHASAPLVGDRTYGIAPARDGRAPLQPRNGQSRGATRTGTAGGSLVLPSGKVLSFTRIALHAARVIIPRPDGSLWTLHAPIPSELTDLWQLLGGEPLAWDMAVTCILPSPQGRAPLVESRE
jgi:23S rRNA pseudouridine1911/1915/1917 synthase